MHAKLHLLRPGLGTSELKRGSLKLLNEKCKGDPPLAAIGVPRQAIGIALAEPRILCAEERSPDLAFQDRFALAEARSRGDSGRRRPGVEAEFKDVRRQGANELRLLTLQSLTLKSKAG